MSNWIDSGGETARLWTDDGGAQEGNEKAEACTARWRAPLIAGLAVVLLGLASQLGHARDRGQFANANPELRAWFNGLKSQKGPCCSDADGSAISDADWKAATVTIAYASTASGYAPDEAVITEPNRIGRTMVWPIRDGVGGLYIRCFMPGSMT